MDTWIWIAIAGGVAFLLLALMVGMFRGRRSRERTEHLRGRFGPEYERAVEQLGGRSEAEAELEARIERRARLDIVTLDPERRERYREAWQGVQGRFVEMPTAAIGEANGLVIDVMRERGYPIDDFDQRAADISVDHPEVVEHYRAAREVVVGVDEGRADTEDMRSAMLHIGALLDELLDADPDGDGAVPPSAPVAAGTEAGQVVPVAASSRTARA